MAKTRSKTQGKAKNSAKKVRKKGPDSVSDIIRTKSVDEVIGITPLELSEEEDDEMLGMDGRRRCDSQNDLYPPPLSPKSSLREIKRADEARDDLMHFIHMNNQCNSALLQGKNTNPPILRSSTVIRNLEESMNHSVKPNKVKITIDDIEDEVNFWQPSIVCYVLGSNPPLHILEGFANRLWKDKIDKVRMLTYGVFIIRFNSMEYRDQVLNGGYIFFNRRPVIMKPWDANTNFRKEDVKTLPIWIQLEGLEIKYWGQRSLFKIVGMIGKPVMVDSVTRDRDRLNYPRVLVEVLMHQEFPSMLEFEDEHGSMVSVGVKYEWKPDLCTNCSGLGHLATDCKKKNGAKREWVVKEDKRKEKPKVDDEGFQAVSKGKKVQEQKTIVNETSTSNGFQVLDGVNDDMEVMDMQWANDEQPGYTREGGGPSLGNG
uniref:CCHC-type domain-containing protein n=1 Tax=Cannabis sativa TaxID=3483 RepID=A0A803NFJ2_CANSA